MFKFKCKECGEDAELVVDYQVPISAIVTSVDNKHGATVSFPTKEVDTSDVELVCFRCSACDYVLPCDDDDSLLEYLKG